jgi:zinc protease
VHGLPDDYYDRYRERVRGVTREQILEAAQRHLYPEALQLVVVGDPGVVQDRLAALEFGPVALYDAAGQRAE